MTAERATEQSAQLEVEFQQFKEREGFTHALGIIGGSEVRTIALNRAVITDTLRHVQETVGKFAIVSGGTRDGVPEMALDIGRDLGLPTVGVFPQEGAKYAATEKIDFSIAVPPQALSSIKWGIETPTLVSIPDAFVLIGGEWGTLTEVATIMKRNSRLTAKGKLPVPIYAVIGSGKLADSIQHLAAIFPTPEGSLYACESPQQLTMHLINTFSIL